MLFSRLLKFYQKNISFRLVLTGLMLAAFFCLFLAALQFVFAINNHVQSIQYEISQLIISAQASAQSAIFEFNFELAQEIVRGMLKNEAIVSAEIMNENQSILATDVKEIESNVNLPYLKLLVGEAIQKEVIDLPIPTQLNEPLALAGKLTVHYNLHIPLQKEIDNIIVNIAYLLIAMTLFSLVIILLFHYFLLKPVKALSQQLRMIKVGGQTQTRIHGAFTSRDDEIGHLAHSINHQLDTVEHLLTAKKQSLHQMQCAYKNLQTLIESLPNLISVSSLNGEMLLANQAFLKVFDLNADTTKKTNIYQLLNERIRPSEFQQLLDIVKEVHTTKQSELLPEVGWRKMNGPTILMEMRIMEIQYQEQQCILMVSNDVSDSKAQQAHVQHLAYHDSLTELPNRLLFLDRLEQALMRAQRSQKHGALVFVDLDDFKLINDTKGHLVGDAVLMEVAKRITHAVREVDTVARIGGDEFLVCMTDLSLNEKEAHAIAINRVESILENLKQPFYSQRDEFYVSASLGLAFFNDHRMTASELLSNADLAMYEAKRTGKNKFSLFEKSLADAQRRALRLKQSCHDAIQKNQFFLVYQPQFDSKSGCIIGAEALLRWDHPTEGCILPNEFIHILEKHELMGDVGEMVLEQAISQTSDWYTSGLIDDHFQMCINVSPQQFRLNDFAVTVSNIVMKNKGVYSLIRLEITEGIIIDDIDHTIEAMRDLRRLGIDFSVDDFGTGYSNLTYLKELPVSTLKVDQSFIKDISNDVNDRAIVSTIIAMAAKLGLATIAEGVETKEQLQLLQQLECFIYQGYLYSPPLKTLEFEQLLQRQLP